MYLREYTGARTKTSLGIEFNEGYSNGGAPVLDYTVTYTYGGAFTTVVSGVTSSPYTATDLATGYEYTFSVQARNKYGLS